MMISVATVINKRLEETYLPILLDSIIKGMPSVSEIVLAKYDAEPGFVHEEVVEGKKIVRFYSGQPKGNLPTEICVSHALNLHAAIDRASNDLVMICDGDVFFYPGVAELYKGLMDQYAINYIGCSHPAAVTEAFTFFPNVLNVMFRKSEMPDQEFLKDHLWMSKTMGITWTESDHYFGIERPLPGKYLLPSNVSNQSELFPNPTGHYETGCNVILWAKEKNWKWLSFQTPDVYNYSTQYQRSNFKLTGKIPRQKILYHATSGSIERSEADEKFEQYKKNYALARAAIEEDEA